MIILFSDYPHRAKHYNYNTTNTNIPLLRFHNEVVVFEGHGDDGAVGGVVEGRAAPAARLCVLVSPHLGKPGLGRFHLK